MSDVDEARIIIALSGKRKSGKDYIADLLLERLGANACILRLSGPLKRAYAEEHGLDYSRLLDASDYKEKYRSDMIAWGETRRRQSPGFFCRLATEQADQSRRVWIVSDARRKTDLAWFVDKCRDTGYRKVFVRVEASTDVRSRRGWVFTPNVDDAESECDLDDYSDFDMTVANNGDPLDNVESALRYIVDKCTAT